MEGDFDEFGNYVGELPEVPAVEEEDEEEDVAAPCWVEPPGGALPAPPQGEAPTGRAVILAEDKQYYPSAMEARCRSRGSSPTRPL